MKPVLSDILSWQHESWWSGEYRINDNSLMLYVVGDRSGPDQAALEIVAHMLATWPRQQELLRNFLRSQFRATLPDCIENFVPIAIRCHSAYKPSDVVVDCRLKGDDSTIWKTHFSQGEPVKLTPFVLPHNHPHVFITDFGFKLSSRKASDRGGDLKRPPKRS